MIGLFRIKRRIDLGFFQALCHLAIIFFKASLGVIIDFAGRERSFAQWGAAYSFFCQSIIQLP
jgi:hypothetical protein